MSPFLLDEKLNIKSVAVIGAGPCGLAAAKYLAAERKFERIKVFEQRATVGDVWNHTPLPDGAQKVSIPRTQPASCPDEPDWIDRDGHAQFVSPVYDFLETNIPHTLMKSSTQRFPDGSSLFPKHPVVTRYLNDYAKELQNMLCLSTQVVRVSKAKGEWDVEVRDPKTGQSRVESFGAVMVANGHYNDPFIPAIPGLAEFNLVHPGTVSHSKCYRRPDHYAGKKVVIVGNSASGVDLSAQIATVFQQPIIISEKSTPVRSAVEEPWCKHVPEIAECLPKQRAIRLSDNTIETDIDAIVFCTGYFYCFPFLDPKDFKLSTDGSWVRNLYEHILYIEDPTLCFLGIPQRVVPFPIAEAQSAFVARAWADRLVLPRSC